MQDRIGLVYEIVASIIGVVGGALIIILRKRFYRLNKKLFSKRSDFLNKAMLKSMENRTEKETYFLYTIIGLVLVVVSIFVLVRDLRMFK